MCGITVYISKEEQDDRKLNNVSHRGPDSSIIRKFKFQDYYISLAFHRLAIIDIDNGDQPFIYKDCTNERQIYLLCNGEIYNYKKLIEKYNFKTKSDCHVILDLYLDKGIDNIEEIVKELDGEFAFVLIDIYKNKMKVVYARDRFGIRPLFYYFDNTGYYFSSELKGLPFKGLGSQVDPRDVYHLCLNDGICYYKNYYSISKNINDNINTKYEVLLEKINKSLTTSIRDRMQSNRPLGSLLSGGLDSSLISGIASKILKEDGKRLTTFSIGIEEDSPDIQYARKVANHINSIHNEIIIPVEIWIENLKNVIKQIETYDITTIRASTGQYLLSKWISENTDIKVILNGDGSDELTAGYLYFYNSPDSDASHEENIRLLDDIHNYDVLRVDRGISSYGLESRVPFLSHNFVDLYLSIDKTLRNPIKGERVEKFMLRKAFETEHIIPHDVLWRKKEAFSDGCSSSKKSWYQYIQEYVETQVSDEEFSKYNISNFLRFPSKESYWYYKIFKEYYPNSTLEIKYWMPKWCNEHGGDPSARKLNVY